MLERQAARTREAAAYATPSASSAQSRKYILIQYIVALTLPQKI
jgi:hypothetical protein